MQASYAQWFVEHMRVVLDSAFYRAQKVYHNEGKKRVANMQIGLVLGKWYSTNVINHGGYSLSHLAREFGLKLPDILTTGSSKQEQEYSSKANLMNLINQCIDAFGKHGMEREAKQLANQLQRFNDRVADLFKEESEDVGTSVAANADKRETLSKQQLEAERAVNDVIASLPKAIQHTIRTEVARRGNTLQALQQVMSLFNRS